MAWRRANGIERRRYSIVLIGVSVVIVCSVIGALVPAVSEQRVDGPEALDAVALLALASAIAIAVVRYRLYNLRVVISRTVLVVLVGVLLSAVYLAVLVVLARLLDESTGLSVPGVAAAGAVVVATAPVVSWATTTTRRWFGRATDPTTVAARFSDRRSVDGDADSVVERLAATVRDELRLGSVEITVVGTEPVVAGDACGPAWSMPLDYQGRDVGTVVVTGRPGERIAEADRRTLEQLGHYLAVTAEAIRVGEDLRDAQQALQDAYLEERRRVRLDLHDGIGPTLASIRLRLLSLKRRLPAEPSVDDLIDQTADAIREVRRIVDGLQPSILEDLGLVPALQILVADTRQASGIDVTISTDADLSDLPAHISTTSYRVVAEGLANVVRHSKSSVCTIQLTRLADQLDIAIRDNGCGFDPTIPDGDGSALDRQPSERGGWRRLDQQYRGRRDDDRREVAGMKASPLRVVIADDHPVFRDGLAHLIGDLDGIDVVAVAANGHEVVELAERVAPDVIIMDLRMPELDGIEATRRITAADPSIGVVVLTMFEEDELLLAAVRAGARGYLLKDADEDEIATVLRGVARGEAIFGPGLAGRILDHLGAIPASAAGGGASVPPAHEP